MQKKRQNICNIKDYPYLCTAFKKCLPHRGMRVRFITGVGDYVLTNVIRKELDEVYSLRCTYTVGTPGVTIVTVR